MDTSDKTYTKDEILRILGVRIKQKKTFSYVDDGITELGGSVFSEIVQNLSIVNKKDLYDFLDVKIASSAQQIEKRRQELYTINSNNANKDTKVTATGKLLGHVSSVLGNDMQRKQYNKALDNLVFKEVFQKIDQAFLASKIITPEQYKILLEDCSKKNISKDKAEYYIFHYCEKKGMTVVEPKDNDFVNQKTCRICSTSNLPQATVCKNCAFPLVVVCPKCSRKSNDPNELKCTQCGFSIGDMPNAENMVIQANKAFTIGNLEVAEKYIGQAELYWSTYPPIQDLKDKIRQEQNAISNKLKKVEEYRNNKEYVSLLAFLKNLNIKNPQLSLYENEAEISMGKAREILSKANSVTDKASRLDMYMQALSICADLEEVKRELKLTPPQMPENLQLDVVGKTVRLSWIKLPSKYIGYTIIRKENGMPRNYSDGEIVAKITDSRYDDTNVPTGISYYYAVFSHCGEVYSTQGSIVGPIMTIEDINLSQIKYSIQKTQINFSYPFPPHAKKIAFYRNDELVKVLHDENFTDTELTPGVKYTYKFIVLYEDCLGKELASRGVSLELTPTVPPEPIKKLSIQKEGENVVLSWTQESKSADIRILQTTKPISKPIGTILSIGELEKTGKLFTPSTSSTIVIPLLAGILKSYYSVWSVWGNNGTAIGGIEIEHIDVPDVTQLKAYISSGKVYVEWNWPSGCNQVKVSYSNNSFEDKYKISKSYPHELYQKQQAFVISPVVNKDYFIEVQTQRYDGKQEILSFGVRTILTNSDPMTIKYELKISTFLMKKMSVNIQNNTNTPLPELVLVSCYGHIPARREDGEVIHIVPQGTKAGSVNLSIDHMRKNYYGRLFITDQSLKNIKIITPGKDKLKLF